MTVRRRRRRRTGTFWMSQVKKQHLNQHLQLPLLPLQPQPKKEAPPKCIDGWRVAYRTEFPERAKTKDVKRRLRTAFVKFDKAALTKKFNQPASRHRAFNKDAAKRKCARAKVRAKVVKRMRAIRAEAKAGAA